MISTRTIIQENLRVDRLGLVLVAVESHDGEFLHRRWSVLNELRAHGGRERDRRTVSTWPGSISITRIREATSSFLRLSVKLRTAALVAQ